MPLKSFVAHKRLELSSKKLTGVSNAVGNQSGGRKEYAFYINTTEHGPDWQ